MKREAVGGKEYQIQVTMEWSEWKDAFKVTDGKGGEMREEKFESDNAKYVRLYTTSKILEKYGYSICIFQVIGFKKSNFVKLRNKWPNNKFISNKTFIEWNVIDVEVII